MHFVLIGFTLMVILSVYTIYTLLRNLPVDQWTFLKVALLRTKVRWSLSLVDYKYKYTNTSIVNTFQSLSPKATVHLMYYNSHRSILSGSAGTVSAAKSRQSCPTLCDPIDSSPPGSPVPGILQAGTLEWVDISFSNAWKWKVKVKSLQLLMCPTLDDPMDCSLPGSSAHGIFQARALEWVAIAFSSAIYLDLNG